MFYFLDISKRKNEGQARNLLLVNDVIVIYERNLIAVPMILLVYAHNNYRLKKNDDFMSYIIYSCMFDGFYDGINDNDLSKCIFLSLSFLAFRFVLTY